MRAGIFGSLGSAFAALCCAGAPAVFQEDFRADGGAHYLSDEDLVGVVKQSKAKQSKEGAERCQFGVNKKFGKTRWTGRVALRV